MKRSMFKLIGAFTFVVALSSCELPMPPGAPEPTAAPVADAPTAASSSGIVADAVVLPNRAVDLTFDMAGTVAEVLVKQGDSVEAGTPLARLVTRDLELQVEQRKANLAQSQAAYDRIKAGARPEEIAAQQAAVQNVEANLERTRQGNVTAADIAGAQAQLRQAEAALASIRNPSAGDLSAAKERVQQAETALQSIRDSASQAKTSGELALQQAVDALTQAQASYSKAKSDWAYVQETGNDPLNPEIADAAGKKVDNELSESGRAQYATAFVQAEAQLHSAERAVAVAQVAFDQARKNEVSSVRTAESQLADAQGQLAALQNPDRNRVMQQQAVVDQARANLRKVQQGGTQAEIAAAQALVAQQQANLERLSAPARTVDLAEAQAQIEVAQIALKQAEHEVAKATLRAPFAGTIAARNLEIGQQVGGGAAAANVVPFVLADFANWKIDTDNLNERDVVRVQVGSPAEITFDALPSLSLTGKISTITPRGVDRYGDKTYTVTITPETWDERLRWNMTASVSITRTP